MIGFEQNKSPSHARLFMRFTLDVLALFVTFLGPWWLTLLLAILLIIFLKAYETILCGLVLDSIYANGTMFSQFGDFAYTSILLLTVSVSWLIAPYLRGIEKH